LAAERPFFGFLRLGDPFGKGVGLPCLGLEAEVIPSENVSGVT
jgi:hypothetical protein